MAVFKCKMCGGTLEFSPGDRIAVCDSCGSKQTLPQLDDNRLRALYERADALRRADDFDGAAAIYEQIVTENADDAEAYWALVLCRYGVEYVEDPATRRRMPTINRAQYTGIFDDENYRAALRHASPDQRALYESEAREINEIQKSILSISQKEEPFDIFICYKETDERGRRTPDSVLANDMYHQLTQAGFKVFFSRITLEDKLGSAYEPYIFAALNSARVMVVLGTRPEYFGAVWVKNEWSRYLALIKSGADKTLIPAYRDMDPYDLPEEFSHLQAQDMSRLGFMQDLIRGIEKILGKSASPSAGEPAFSKAVDIPPLLKRISLFLEDKNWKEAAQYCERVLDREPENAQVYLFELMAELEVSTVDELSACSEPFDERSNYKKAVRFGDEEMRAMLTDCTAQIYERNHSRSYRAAQAAMDAAKNEADFEAAAARFDALSDYRDSEEQKRQCLLRAEAIRKDRIYFSVQKALANANSVISYKALANELSEISGWRDADAIAAECREKANQLIRQKEENQRRQEQLAAEENAREERLIALIAAILCIIAGAVIFITLLRGE